MLQSAQLPSNLLIWRVYLNIPTLPACRCAVALHQSCTCHFSPTPTPASTWRLQSHVCLSHHGSYSLLTSQGVRCVCFLITPQNLPANLLRGAMRSVPGCQTRYVCIFQTWVIGLNYDFMLPPNCYQLSGTWRGSVMWSAWLICSHNHHEPIINMSS